MVWEVESTTIVMMTRLEERMRKKCDQYWPTRGTETYGLMTVTITATQELATYCIRTFQLTKANTNESREIKQVQYTNWPDHVIKQIIFKEINNTNFYFCFNLGSTFRSCTIPSIFTTHKISYPN